MSGEPPTDDFDRAPSRKRSLLEHSLSVPNADVMFGGPSSFYRDGSGGGSSGLPPINEGANLDKLPHPNMPAFRRARAETFSSFNRMLPSDLTVPPTLSDLPSHHQPQIAAPGSNRLRGGSLNLPPNNFSNAFGPSLFAPNWQPSSIEPQQMSPSNSHPGKTLTPPAGETGGNNVQAAFESMPMYGWPTSNENINRTLNLLSLEDLNNNNDYSAAGVPLMLSNSNSSSTGGYPNLASRQHVIQQGSAAAASPPYGKPSNLLNRATSSPKLGLEGTPYMSPSSSTAVAQQNRLRSYSVNVGDLVAMDSGSPQGFKPRSTSFGFLEGSQIDTSSFIGGPMRVGVERTKSNSSILSESLLMEEQGYGTLDSNVLPSELQTPSRSLWVGNIDPAISPADLLAVFGSFGPIESLRILPDKDCAFIYFVHIEDAIRAKEQMQGVQIGATSVRLGYGRADLLADSQNPTKSLWIGNMPPTMDPNSLEAIFRAFGPVESARVVPNKNYGFVNFDRAEDAVEARYALNGKEIAGYVLKIGFAKVPSAPPMPYQTFGQQPFPNQQGGQPGSVYGSPYSAGGSGISIRERSQSNPTSPSLTPAATTATSPVSTLTTRTSQNFNTNVSGNVPMIVFDADGYAPSLLPLPEPNPHRRIDQSRLREMRKRLEGHPTPKEVDAYFHEIYSETIELCTDYIGNVVLQKIIEKGNDGHLLHLLEAVAPLMPTLGVHKNGTWVIQKMIDFARTPAQMSVIVSAIRPFTPPLLLDQFGNYVVQCCLRLGTQRNQFIFDAMNTKCWEVGQGRFGARAMRTCLESQYTNKRQQKHVAIAIVQNAVLLVTNPNGSLLLTWLLDNSGLPGRYRVLAPKLAPHIAGLCTHKLGSGTILKLVNQQVELDARETVIKEIFHRPDSTLQSILSDHVHGMSIIHKILSTSCVSPEERVGLADKVRSALSKMMDLKENHANYKRLMDELTSIPTNTMIEPNVPTEDGLDTQVNDEPVSPLMTHMVMEEVDSPAQPAATPNRTSSPSNNGGGGQRYPSPSHSPQLAPSGGNGGKGNKGQGKRSQSQPAEPPSPAASHNASSTQPSPSRDGSKGGAAVPPSKS